MIKKPLEIALFICVNLLIANSTISQDLIVTTYGDSLNCKITSVKPDKIYFTFRHNDEIRSTLLFLDQVKFYQYNYFQTASVPADKIVKNDTYNKIRFSLNGGWSRRIAKTANTMSPDLEEYINDLKSGFGLGFDFSYFTSESFCFGLKYHMYRSKNSIGNVTVSIPDGPTLTGKMSDDISIFFFGPIVGTRFYKNNMENALVMNLGLGYMGYFDNAVLISPFKITGNTIGMYWDIGYDFRISTDLAVSLQFSYLLGTLTKYKISGGGYTETVELEENSYESLLHIDLSVGLRFNF